MLRLALQLQRKDSQQIAALSHLYIQERQAQEPAMPKTGPVFKDPLGFLAKDLIARAGLRGKIIFKSVANNKILLAGTTLKRILASRENLMEHYCTAKEVRQRLGMHVGVFYACKFHER